MGRKNRRNVRVSKRLVAPTIPPEWAFLVLGILCGVVTLVITPPFEIPDEPQHFFRAFQLSEGGLRDFTLLKSDNASQTVTYGIGAMLPKSLGGAVESSDLASVRLRPEGRVQPAKIRAALTAPLNSGDREYLPVTTYAPAGYLPQVIGIGIGRLLGLSPMFLLYLGRVCALAAWLGLTFAAIRITPILKWAFLTLALMPMTLFIAASNSADSAVLGASFLMSAVIFRCAFDKTKKAITFMDLGLLLVLAVILALSKPVYVSLLLLYFLIPTDKAASMRMYYAAIASILLVAAASYWGWGLLSSPTAEGVAANFSRFGVDSAPFTNVVPAKQIEYIRNQPAALINVFAHTLSVAGPLYLDSFVGYLGWLDTPLPAWLIYSYLIALLTACLASSGEVSWRSRLLGAGVFLSTALGILVLLYLSWSSVGMNRIEGMQGRYLLPIAPALLLVFSADTGARIRNIVSVLLLAFVVLSSSVSAYALVERFYLPAVPAYRFDPLTTAPDGTLVISGWAIDKENGELPAEVAVGVDGQFYPAQYRRQRPDAAKILGNPALENSGFELRLPGVVLGPGRHRLTVRILKTDRRSYEVLPGYAPFDLQ